MSTRLCTNKKALIIFQALNVRALDLSSVKGAWEYGADSKSSSNILPTWLYEVIQSKNCCGFQSQVLQIAAFKLHSLFFTGNCKKISKVGLQLNKPRRTRFCSNEHLHHKVGTHTETKLLNKRGSVSDVVWRYASQIYHRVGSVLRTEFRNVQKMPPILMPTMKARLTHEYLCVDDGGGLFRGTNLH